MEWYQWATLFGVPTVISGLIMIPIKKAIDRSDAKRAEEEQKRVKREKEIKAQNDAMEKQNTALMAGVQAILRDRLLICYRHYAEKGWADYEDRMNVENMYKQYHTLGANGVMDKYHEKFMALPEYPPVNKENRQEV